MEPLGKGCDRSVRTPELLQNAASGGVRERAERGIEVGLAILSHTVQYTTWVTACNGRLSALCSRRRRCLGSRQKGKRSGESRAAGSAAARRGPASRETPTATDEDGRPQDLTGQAEPDGAGSRRPWPSLRLRACWSDLGRLGLFRSLLLRGLRCPDPHRCELLSRHLTRRFDRALDVAGAVAELLGEALPEFERLGLHSHFVTDVAERPDLHFHAVL